MQVGVFEKAFEFNPVTITGKNLRVIGCLGGDYPTALRLLDAGKIDPKKFIKIKGLKLFIFAEFLS